MSDTKECPFCAEVIKTAAKKCRFCGEFLEGHNRDAILGDYIGGDKVSGNKTTIDDIKDVNAAAIGKESTAINTGNVETFIHTTGKIEFDKNHRDKQYEIALNWIEKGRPIMRIFDLSERDLSGVYFVSADFGNTKLSKAIFREANLNNANLSNSDLSYANLSHANLSYSDLRDSNLKYANLSHANLRYAKLRNSSLSRANLSHTDLSYADFSHASLSWATLWGAIMTETILFKTSCNWNTVWPSGFNRLEANSNGKIYLDDFLDFDL